MPRQVSRSVIILSAMLFASSSEAFVVSSRTQRSSSSLQLLPDQADQLVAAYNALKEDDKKTIQVHKEEDAEQNWGASTIAASKSLLTRVFHLDSVLHPLERKEDVCYYPMVGFRFIEGQSIPTKPSVCCAMPTKSQREEELYGFFTSPENSLDLFSQEICFNPIGDVNSNPAFYSLKNYNGVN